MPRRRKGPAGAPRWAGWHRHSTYSPWRRLVEAGSKEECADLLDACVEGGQTAVLPVSLHPLDREGKAP